MFVCTSEKHSTVGDKCVCDDVEQVQGLEAEFIKDMNIEKEK